jgi:xanthine dehydrogenase accessory factor
LNWLERVRELIREHRTVVRVVIVEAKGTTPRELGAAMLLTASTHEGTVGDGPLEQDAIAAARSLMLRSAHPDAVWLRQVHQYPLGPVLDQDSGGHMRLLFELFGPREAAALDQPQGPAPSGDVIVARPLRTGSRLMLVSGHTSPTLVPPAVRDAIMDIREHDRISIMLVNSGAADDTWLVERAVRSLRPFYVYGAGHVGRALVHALRGLPFDVRWVDTEPARFPEPVPSHLARCVSGDPVAVAGAAVAGSYHAVMTYSHQMDFDICLALLQANVFGYLGLVGSVTKRQRFLARLREAGVGETALARLICPIGAPGIIGKEPAVIAIAVAAQAIAELRRAE